ncbi:MAG TPA: molybdopterin-dependent oxidoreductase [Spirochaetota bacterium]|nr:molybdopterin-dependent oxidoreductase [Spirochaetota bacterium]HPJ35261.1 molybdopterin-dependent oxidoreductase [Spirochaetota bacterium]
MKKIDRKDFLKIGSGAVVGGLAGYTLSGAPFLGFQWLVEWTQDQYVPAPGIEKYVKAVSDSCTCGCKVSVRKIGDRAVKIESKEGVCPACLNGLQLLYHPERIAAPMKRTGSKGSGNFQPVSWEQALKDISSKMNSIINEGKANTIAAVNKNESLNGQLMEKFIKAAGSNNVYYESSLNSITSQALGGYIKYNFSNTDYILSFGSRLVEGWGDAVDMQKQFLNWKKKNVKIVQADSVCTRTGSIATEFVGIKPGTEAILAFGIANYLITGKKKISSGGEFAKWSQIIINKYPLGKVAQITGIAEDKIKKIADEFAAAKNPVAVAGKGGYGVSGSSAEIIAVYCLNTLVKSKAASLVKNSAVSYSAEFAGLDGFIKDGNFAMMFLNGSDPVYKSVLGDDLKKKLEKAFVVSIAPLMNDSSAYADYILPPLSFLEAETKENKPVVKALKETKDAKEIITSLAAMVDKTKNALPKSAVVSGRESAVSKFSFNVSKIKAEIDAYEKKVGQNAEYPVTLVPIEIPLVGDGDGLAFPYVLKSIDPSTMNVGKFYVQMNRETADKYGFSEGSSIKITSARGKLGKAYVHLTDVVAPETVAIPLGFGHESYTKYGNEKGLNPKKIMTADVDPLTGTADWWSTRVKIS